MEPFDVVEGELFPETDRAGDVAEAAEGARRPQALSPSRSRRA
ncbi:hypothetical protein [Microbacterium sp. C7(2022)]|nr:hypothetical protein [Microbacterium sp. C7(2022)]MDE0547607.1 hypothetical protein [Microbacterium sp. C7(2022)]